MARAIMATLMIGGQQELPGLRLARRQRKGVGQRHQPANLARLELAALGRDAGAAGHAPAALPQPVVAQHHRVIKPELIAAARTVAAKPAAQKLQPDQQVQLADPWARTGILECQQREKGCVIFGDEIAALDLHAAEPVAPLDMRQQLDQLDTMRHWLCTIWLADQQRHAVGHLQRVRPQAAHLANQVLGTDRLEIAGGHADIIHLPSGQKVRYDLTAWIGGQQCVRAKPQCAL